MLFQPPIPLKYSSMSEAQRAHAILTHKNAFGPRLAILGHHYQQDEVIQFADFVGDSLKLAQFGARQTQADFIVFCGVHFMAESADILTDSRVRVILPDLSAGCSMADMAELDQLEQAWDYLVEECGEQIVPITYVNSSAAIKAFCGGHGGACCTSSNAKAILEWALSRGDKVIFLPDQHLGRNASYSMGIPLESMAVYDPRQVHGGLTGPVVKNTRVFLWKGHCSVHGLFTAKQCDAIRHEDSECKILVHPECPWDVVQTADLAGSTEFIIKTVHEASPGSRWAIGTEIHLVNRLAKNYPEQSIRSLAGIQCLCTTMYRIDSKHLLWCLDELAAGRVVNEIRVDSETRNLARIALDRMLSNVPAQPVAIR